MEILDPLPFSLDFDAVAARVHVAPDDADAPALRDLIARVQQVARPKALYHLGFIEARAAEALEINGVTFTSRVLSVNLKDVHRVFAYVVTCGREFDAIDTGGDPLQEYWLDQLRMATLAAARSYLRDHIDLKYQPGALSSMSPGSLPDWPISQQRPLFSLLGDVYGKIGVELTDSYLMLPLKSVSGLLFPTEVTFASCQLCPREGCPGRSAPYDPALWQQRYAQT